MTLRNHDIAELRRLDLAHHLPAQADHGLMQKLGGSTIITRAQGCHIYDGDGRAILDGMAGLWCVQVGYGREELAQAAYDQMIELPYYNTFFKTATPPTVKLAAKIASLMGGNLSHVFFNSSGSEARAALSVKEAWRILSSASEALEMSSRTATSLLE